MTGTLEFGAVTGAPELVVQPLSGWNAQGMYSELAESSRRVRNLWRMASPTICAGMAPVGSEHSLGVRLEFGGARLLLVSFGGGEYIHDSVARVMASSYVACMKALWLKEITRLRKMLPFRGWGNQIHSQL
jgi:hypothetical protein